MLHTERNVDESKWCVLVESCLCESFLIIEHFTFNRKLIPKAGNESRLQIKKRTSNTPFPHRMLPKLHIVGNQKVDDICHGGDNLLKISEQTTEFTKFPCNNGWYWTGQV